MSILFLSLIVGMIIQLFGIVALSKELKEIRTAMFDNQINNSKSYQNIKDLITGYSKINEQSINLKRKPKVLKKKNPQASERMKAWWAEKKAKKLLS